MSLQAVKLHHHRHVGARPCYLYPSSLEHNTNCALSLHWAFHLMLVVLKGNLNSKRAVLSVFPTTSCFTIPLLDVVAKLLHLHEISRQMCHDHHQHSELLEGINWMHVEKYHPFPSMTVLSSTPVLLSLQHKRVRVLCCPLCSSLYSLCYLLPWSITIWYVKNVVKIARVLRILDIVILLTITIHFLVPCCFKPEYQQVNSDVWFQYFWQPYGFEVND